MTLSRIALIVVSLPGGALAGIAMALGLTYAVCWIIGSWDVAFRQAGWSLVLVTAPVGAVIGMGLAVAGAYWVGHAFL